MGDVTPGFVHDRAMSLHRRAYGVMEGGGTISTWFDLAKRLECPEDAMTQIWNAAKLAFEDKSKPKEFFFPLMGELERQHEQNQSREG